MKKIKVNEIYSILDAAPIEMNVMLIGDTGIGKTQIIKKYAEDRGLYLKTLILSQLEASEALGIPVQSKRTYNGKEYSTIETAVPTWVFDLAEHENSMLYLDEFLCAEPSVMNSVLNFLTEKNVNGIDLSHVKVVAATNIGNYTYEPDNNILSRFCMFYVTNDSFTKYLDEKYKKISKIRIRNNYKDEEELDGIIFEQRSLKPRCQEMLYMLKDEKMMPFFFEGYTNRAYMPTFHSNSDIQEILGEFVKEHEDIDEIGDAKYYLESECYDNLAALLFAKIKDTKKTAEWATKYKNLTYSQWELQNKLQYLLDNASNNY